MKEILSMRVLKRIFVLAVLSIGLVFAVITSENQSVQAAPCCEDCDASWNQCMADCTPGDWSCFADCADQNNDCSSHCIMCGTGGGGGGSCQVASDCPPRPENPFPQCVGWNCVY